MTRPAPLSPDALHEALASLEGWELVEGRLHREFRFADFSVAFGFMSAAAIAAAELDHHPEWTNVYSRVEVDLVTHDPAGITELDVQLATRMSAIAAGLPSSG